MKNNIKILDIGTRLIVAAIFGFTAYTKFAGTPEVVYIFQRIGMESAGRYVVAILEVVAIVLLLVPRTAWRGAILGALMMFGAICMHLTMGEINIMGDGGLMFAASIVVLFCCMSILVFHRAELEAELN
ncbi:MAG: DoxX family protein [Sphingobacteriales bacterium]|jgi:putative oxidoreductase|nr:DoxX family protein [Sphingobacteriales bacterium]